MRRLASILALVFSLTAPLEAQQTDLAATGVLETREELRALLAELEATASSTAYSSSLRDRARTEAELIAERLQRGDFRVGDRVFLLVSIQGQPLISDTLRVVQGPSVFLGEIGEIGLGGVLRSELRGHMADELSRYLRDPRIDQANTFIRLSFVGAVTQQGELYLPAEALMGEALNEAGVGSGGDLEEVTISRGGTILWDAEAVRMARREGRTLDQMSLQAGDEIQVPEAGGSGGWITIVQVAGGIIGSIGLLLAVF